MSNQLVHWFGTVGEHLGKTKIGNNDYDTVIFSKGSVQNIPVGEVKPLKIEIVGRRWFQKSYGNTYHSVVVYINGGEGHTVPFAYGYGDGYIQTGLDKAEEVLGRKLARWWGDRNFVLETSVIDVKRKKDLV